MTPDFVVALGKLYPLMGHSLISGSFLTLEDTAMGKYEDEVAAGQKRAKELAAREKEAAAAAEKEATSRAEADLSEADRVKAEELEQSKKAAAEKRVADENDARRAREAGEEAAARARGEVPVDAPRTAGGQDVEDVVANAQVLNNPDPPISGPNAGGIPPQGRTTVAADPDAPKAKTTTTARKTSTADLDKMLDDDK